MSFLWRKELRTAAIGKQDLVPKSICQSCFYLTSIKNLQPRKKLYKIAWSPFFAEVCTEAVSQQQIKNLYEKAAAKCLTHTGISEPVTGIDWFLLKLLVHISLFTSPKSITNLVWGFLSYSSTLEGSTSWKRAHHKHCLLEDRLRPF